MVVKKAMKQQTSNERREQRAIPNHITKGVKIIIFAANEDFFTDIMIMWDIGQDRHWYYTSGGDAARGDKIYRGKTQL